MMNKPFLIVNMFDGLLLQVYERPTLEEAIQCGIELVSHSVPFSVESIRDEFARYHNFYNDDDGENVIEVYILKYCEETKRYIKGF